MNEITQLEIILVFSVCAWIGVVLLAWNKGASDFTTGETIAQVVMVCTMIGFAIAWIIFFGLCLLGFIFLL